MQKIGQFDPDKIYTNGANKQYKIIALAEGRSKHGECLVIVKFLESGNEYTVPISLAKRGRIKDNKIDPNKIYVNGHNEEYNILGYAEGRSSNGAHLVTVRFTKTGHERVVPIHVAKCGDVRDNEVDSETIYTNTKGQRYQIVAFTKKRGNNVRCKVRFLDTGFEKDAPYDMAKKGYVRDNSVPLVDMDKVYESTKDGPYKILEVFHEGSHYRAHVKFINTGHEKVVDLHKARIGRVKDDTLREIDPNQIYENSNGEKYKIVEKIDPHTAKVHFIDSGYEYEADLYHAKNGKVRDNSKFEFDHNQTFMSYESGPFRVLEKTDQKNNDGRYLYLIEFSTTGYRKLVSYDQIKNRKVYDNTLENPIHDIAKLTLEEHELFIHNRLKNVYYNMMSRCYNKSDHDYKSYGALGIRVCPEWQTFEGFLATIDQVKDYDKFVENFYDYELDKDYLQQDIPKGERVYSPSTCTFLYSADNNSIRIKEAFMNRPHQEYYGVTKSYDHYVMNYCINGNKIVKRFTDPIAAANAYNYYYNLHHNYRLVDDRFNDVYYMPVNEWIKYTTGDHQPIYKTIKEPADSPLVMLGKA